MVEYYSLDGHVISSNENLFTSVKALLPSASDPRIFNNGESSFVLAEGKDENGNPLLVFMIRFKASEKAARDSIFARLNGLGGLFNQCIAGSSFGYHTCFNYSDTVKGCDHTELYRKNWNGSIASVRHIVNGVEQ